jgi:hypothetical protein
LFIEVDISEKCQKPTVDPSGDLWFASIAGLNINPLADKPPYDVECLTAVMGAEPNAALAGIGRLPATVIAHSTFGEMCSGTLTVRVAIDKVLSHPELSKRQATSSLSDD